MARQIIAVDIDDVLLASAEQFVAYSNKKWGTRLTVEDYDEHWGEMWGIDDAELTRRSKHIHGSGVQTTFTHDDTAKPVLEELAKSFELIITTSRTRIVQKGTLEWLDLHYPGIFSDVHFAGIWDGDHEYNHANTLTKGDLHERVRASYVIDDHPKHCFAAAERGIKTLLFGEYPWNRGLKLPPNVTRVKDWRAVKEYFDAQ